MIYWHFRNLQCIVAALFKSKLSSPQAIVTKRFWANPFDSDWMNSVQAGRFFTYTDAARWELAIRMGFLKPALKGRWVVILGGQKIIYRRPLKIFRRFELTLQFVGWDKKWLYAAQVFRQAGDVKCVIYSKIGIRAKGRLVSGDEVFSKMGHSDPMPPPDWLLQYFEDDLALVQKSAELLPL